MPARAENNVRAFLWVEVFKIMPFFSGPVRSPETKEEVMQAAVVLNLLGVIFASVALLGLGLALAYRDPENLIITVVCGGVSLLVFAAGAYNRHYARTMTHTPFVAAALRNPMRTVLIIVGGLTTLVFGIISLLIFLR